MPPPQRKKTSRSFFTALFVLAGLYFLFHNHSNRSNSSWVEACQRLTGINTTVPLYDVANFSAEYFDVRRQLISLSAKFFTYETPFIDIQRAASHSKAFRVLPHSVLPGPVVEFIKVWEELLPFALVYSPPEVSYSSKPAYVKRSNAFVWCDAAVLYAFVRMIKPRRVYEVRSDVSTFVVRDALDAIVAETGVKKAMHLRIEPVGTEEFTNLKIYSIDKPVQEVDLEVFDDLEAGDLLFFDSSHVVKPFGDVIFEILWILPRLKAGVYVHVHDWFLPNEYPRGWIFDEKRMYTEQYFVAAFLHKNPEWEIVFVNNGQFYNVPKIMPNTTKSYEAFCPRNACGGSLYLHKLEPK